MTTLAFTELEARASAVDSFLALARVQVERRAAHVANVTGGFWYACLGRHQLTKFDKALGAIWNDLRDPDMVELANMLARCTKEIAPARQHAEGKVSQMGPAERLVVAKLCALVDDAERLSQKLYAEASKGLRPKFTPSGPGLTPYAMHQAAFASAFLQPVSPDPADATADPDYGF
jgi:hypothetical protein